MVAVKKRKNVVASKSTAAPSWEGGISGPVNRPNQSVASPVPVSTGNFGGNENQSVAPPNNNAVPVGGAQHSESNMVSRSEPINPSTGAPFTSMEAPFGLMPDENGNYRPASQDESGQVMQITGDDLLMAVGGARLVDSAVGAVASIASRFAGRAAATSAGSSASAAVSSLDDMVWQNFAQPTSKLGGIPINSKTVRIAKNVLKKTFSIASLTIVGSWVGSTFFGMWGQAETPEPITIPVSQQLFPLARYDGNWTLVDQYLDAAEEVSSLSKWEKIALGTPLAGFIGIPNKIEGGITGIQVLRAAREYYSSFPSEQERTLQEAKDRADAAKAEVDYYNEQRLLTEDKIAENKLAIQTARDKKEEQILRETGDFWIGQKKRINELEARERVRVAEFWLEYHKAIAKIDAGEPYVYDSGRDTTPSKLSFGLL